MPGYDDGRVAKNAPSTEAVQNLLLPHPDNVDASGTAVGVKAVILDWAASTTLQRWGNPHSKGIVAKAFPVWTTAGTGTFDLGLAADGTAAAGNEFIDGGTMTAGAHVRSGTAGTVGDSATEWQYVGGSGSATSFITTSHNETPTSTAVGKVVIIYTPLDI